jgi:hypothetical protein
MESGEKPFKIAPFLLESKPNKTPQPINSDKQEEAKSTNRPRILVDFTREHINQRTYRYTPSKEEKQFHRIWEKATNLALISTIILTLLSTCFMPENAAFEDKCALILFIFGTTSIGFHLPITIMAWRIDSLVFHKKREKKYNEHIEKIRKIDDALIKKVQEDHLERRRKMEDTLTKRIQEKRAKDIY